MNKIIVLILILIVWLLSGFYSFELVKGETLINSIQVWDFYRNPVAPFRTKNKPMPTKTARVAPAPQQAALGTL